MICKACAHRFAASNLCYRIGYYPLGGHLFTNLILSVCPFCSLARVDYHTCHRQSTCLWLSCFLAFALVRALGWYWSTRSAFALWVFLCLFRMVFDLWWVLSSRYPSQRQWLNRIPKKPSILEQLDQQVANALFLAKTMTCWSMVRYVLPSLCHHRNFWWFHLPADSLCQSKHWATSKRAFAMCSCMILVNNHWQEACP